MRTETGKPAHAVSTTTAANRSTWAGRGSDCIGMELPAGMPEQQAMAAMQEEAHSPAADADPQGHSDMGCWRPAAAEH